MLSLKKKGKISKFTSNLFLLKKNEKYNFKKTQSVKIYRVLLEKNQNSKTNFFSKNWLTLKGNLFIDKLAQTSL